VEQRTVAVGDVDLVVAESGVGGRPFLLLHGLAGAKEDFTEWLDPLAARGWHAVAPDHRGHGGSAKPQSEDAYSFSVLADDAFVLADALGWGRFALLGHSMGGMVAQVMAMASPDRLTGLVLMDTAPGPVPGLGADTVGLAVAVVRDRGMDEFADLMAGGASPLDTPAHRRLVDERPGYAEFGERKLRATSPHLYAALATQIIDTPDRLDDLRHLPPSLPVMVMVGEQDRPFIGPSERMAAAMANAVLAVVADAGHSPQFENPAGWWSALVRFLDRIA
jgi:pimeloyl-ACP methyl ester carboxylesterase